MSRSFTEFYAVSNSFQKFHTVSHSFLKFHTVSSATAAATQPHPTKERGDFSVLGKNLRIIDKRNRALADLRYEKEDSISLSTPIFVATKN